MKYRKEMESSKGGRYKRVEGLEEEDEIKEEKTITKWRIKNELSVREKDEVERRLGKVVAGTNKMMRCKKRD